MTGDDVFLTPHESQIQTWVGRQRNANALRNARNPGLGPAPREQRDILGAHGEFAASLILSVSWRPRIGEIDKADIGDWIEVRTTDIERGCLVIKPDDENQAPFVLVIAAMATLRFRAVGWLYGFEAKRYPITTEFGDPAHYVPQRGLSRLATLRALILAEGAAALGEPIEDLFTLEGAS